MRATSFSYTEEGRPFTLTIKLESLPEDEREPGLIAILSDVVNSGLFNLIEVVYVMKNDHITELGIVVLTQNGEGNKIRIFPQLSGATVISHEESESRKERAQKLHSISRERIIGQSIFSRNGEEYAVLIFYKEDTPEDGVLKETATIERDRLVMISKEIMLAGKSK